ncbi:MAG: HAMP domain-containing histidine kinase, partial [Defluviitaleaceae bacterium]|nr:HAMP domain-containing histidine kinase [Defluviitaleaceae bacterium]
YFPDAGRNFGIMRSTNLHGITFTTAHDLQAHTISIVSMAANEDLIYVSRIIPLIITLLIASVVCAYMLARLIAKPIKKLAHDTKMMTNLMDIDPPPARRDEIGQLAQDVHGMYKQLKHIMENQRGFFSAASHELKTPIAGTTAIIEAMMEGLIDQDEYPAYLEQCLGMMNNQSELISEILEIVRYNDGRIKPNIESFELAPFVLSMLPTYEAIAARKEQSININIPQDQTIRADKTLLSKVMSNVLMNAITNAPERSEIRLWSENGFLYILNTNTHISEEELPRLFEPFYRTDKARTSGDGGNSGLGLAIVKKALDTMQIPFGLENSADGVIFWLDVR